VSAARRGLRAALAVAVLVAAADGFLLWGRTVLDPVDAAGASARFLAGTAGQPGSGPRPPAGVYRYRTSGRETVDRFSVDRVYPGETFRVVSYLGGCRWRETVPVFEQHTETYDFCSGGGDAAELAYATSLTYFLVPGVQRFACDPQGRRLLPAARPGTVLRWRCAGGSSSSENTTTFVGVEAVAAGAATVRARHLRLTTALAGTATGGAVRDLWLDGDGLVVRERRRVHLVVTTAFVGRASYDEQATFELASLTPQR
jgi:hypothetical protein